MEARPPRTPVDELPWYKSPYFWGAVIGVLTLTLIRPCTRYVPEPLDALGPSPEWLAAELPHDGVVRFLTFYSDDCSSCVDTIEGLSTVTRRLSRTPYAAGVVVAHPVDAEIEKLRPVFAYEDDWVTRAVSPGTDWASGAFSRAFWEGRPLPTKWTDFIHIGSVWIIDTQGSLRGPLRTADETGIDEAFYRVQHVIRESSEQSTEGP